MIFSRRRHASGDKTPPNDVRRTNYSHCRWKHLPASLGRRLHPSLYSSDSALSLRALVASSSSVDSPLLPSATSPPFHSRLKTDLSHKSRRIPSWLRDCRRHDRGLVSRTSRGRSGGRGQLMPQTVTRCGSGTVLSSPVSIPSRRIDFFQPPPCGQRQKTLNDVRQTICGLVHDVQTCLRD